MSGRRLGRRGWSWRWAALGVMVAIPRIGRAQQDVLLDSAYSEAEHGAWESSARVWRRVLDVLPTLPAAASNTLRATPPETQPAVRRVFLGPPASVAARVAEAQLEIEWGSPRDGWMALEGLPPTLAVVDAWVDFGADAEEADAPLVARDAFAAALRARPSAELAARVASAALEGDDPTMALAVVDRTSSWSASPLLVPLRVRALARLGRPADAEQLVQGASLDSSARADLGREIAWGFVRLGDVARASAAIQRFGLAGDRVIAGYLALYAGDLATARRALDAAAGNTPDVVMAVALLARTRADSAPVVGHAFVALASGDSARAAEAFVAAASSAALADAAPLLLATAARLDAARRADPLAIPLWRRVVEEYASAPEAPEADLEWGRALKRQADVTGAVARWQHLILTYPESALVPQARRELDLVKAAA